MLLRATRLSAIANAVRNLFRGASLNMNFAGADKLDPRITFSRASNATVTGPDGTLGYAPHNLLTHSEQFDAVSGWLVSRSTITANAAIAPNGTQTADLYAESAVVGSSYLYKTSVTFTAGSQYTSSVYAKQFNGQTLQLFFTTAVGFGSSAAVTFNLDSGTFSAPPNGYSAAMTDEGNGWWRCSLSATCQTTTTANWIMAQLGNEFSDPAYGIYIWGAQLNVGPLQPYYPTTVKNLLGYTQEFGNEAWTKSNATVTANAATAPDGSLTADKLVENTALGAHDAFQTFSSVSGFYTLSIYAKAAERSVLRLTLSDLVAGAAEVDANLLNGTISTPAGSTGSWTEISRQIASIGSGWYRISVSARQGAGTLVRSFSRLTNGISSTYTGDGTSGIYIWGAQLSDSASLDPYVYNPEAAPTAQAYYGPRFDYDPVTLAPKGLLVEEQRTNLLTFSDQMNGTDWGTPAGGTVVVDQSVAPDGTTTADHFTQTIAGNILRKTVPLTNGTLYTASVYVRSVSGNTTFVTDIGDVGTNVFTLTTQWQRISFSAIAGAIGHVDFRINGAGTFAIWGAQLEAGAFPTSYIPTTTAAATRAADVAVMTGANFSNWYRQDEGTLFGEFQIPYAIAAGASPRIFALQGAGGAAVDEVALFVLQAAGKSASFNIFTGGVNAGRIDASPNFVSGSIFKSAATYALNNRSVTTSGAAPTVSTATYTIPTNTLARLGAQDSLGNGIPNGHIRRIAYFPRRLSNSELIGITS